MKNCSYCILDFESVFLYDHAKDGEKTMRRIISILLISVMMLSCSVISIAENNGDSSSLAKTLSGLNADEIQSMFDTYIEANALQKDLISIGYADAETGETWYWNEDKQYYSASLYKVPLMMMLSEKVSSGELDAGTEINGMTIPYIEEETLTYSNNDIAYSMLLWFGEPSSVRMQFSKYTTLPEEYFDWGFTAYSNFTARFMTEVMLTLCREPERFPNVAECLKEAQPGHYFRLGLEDSEIEIAQKYGSYHDDFDGSDWNHTAGIFYAEHPFVLTVMTRYGGISEIILSDLAKLFLEYSLSLYKRDTGVNEGV